jgi:hypothetical protein
MTGQRSCAFSSPSGAVAPADEIGDKTLIKTNQKQNKKKKKA